jgi:predicted exporter
VSTAAIDQFVRYRRLIGAVLAVGLIVSLFRIGPDTQFAQTSLLTLLPDSGLTDTEEHILEQLSGAVGNTLLFMLEADSRAVTAEDLAALVSTLEGSNLFASIGADANGGLTSTERLFPWRYHLLTQNTITILDSPEGDRTLINRRLRQLFAPGGFAAARTLDEDPFGFFEGWLLSWLPLDIPLEQGAIRTEDGSLILPATLKASGFDLSTQLELAALMTKMRTDTARQGFRLRIGGIPAFAAVNAQSAKNEVSLVGTGSMLGILLLVLLTFVSLRPLLFALFIVGTGVGAGALACLAIFGQVHLLTWVFGASLIGIAIDYALHVLASGIAREGWTPLVGTRQVFKPTALGLLTSVLGFATLLLTPFPVLREIAVFAVAGLTTAWFLCMQTASGFLRGFVPPANSPFIAAINRITRFRYRLTSRPLAATLIVALCIPGLLRLEPDDRITALTAVNSPVAADDAWIREHLPTRMANQFFSVEAPDLAELFRREQALVTAIKRSGDVARIYALSNLLRTPEEQTRHLRTLSARLGTSTEADRYFATLGYAPDRIRAEHQRWAEAGTRSLQPGELAKNLPPPWSLTWQGCGKGTCRSVVLLDHIRSVASMEAIQLEGVRFVDQVSLLSNRFAAIRAGAVENLVLAVFTVTAILGFMFGLGAALRIVMVPCIGLCVAFAWIGYSGVLYSVFNVFALLLVFGLGIDYAVFEHDAGDSAADKDRTELAILLSALTTLLAFGLLSLSSTTVIAAFGSTLTAGITTCWLLAPLARNSKGKRT